jgi:pimeloyl-ACP methyl ester carboxylesterase
MPRIELDGHSFHYQQSGDGPDVVLVHALTSNLSVWMLTPIVETLAEDFRVTTYDLRGHGMTDAPPAGYTSADMADDLLRLLERLGLERVMLLGHSFGGVIAVHAAAVCPERISGVVLSDSYFPGLADVEPNMASADVWTELAGTLRACGVEIGPTVDFTRLFQAVHDFTPDQEANVRETLGTPGARWLSRLGQLASTSAGREAFLTAGLDASRLRTVAQPVVALYDEHSPFMTTCRWLEQNLPNCTVQIVPGAKHLAPVQNSGEFVPIVAKHLHAMAAGAIAAPADLS